MQTLPSNFETIPVTELNVGDIVRFHGARFHVHTAAMYRQDEDHIKQYGVIGPTMTALATWIDGETVPGYFGPGKDWNFQGNLGHRVRRELASPAEHQYAEIKATYNAALAAACALADREARRYACDAAHARYEAALEELGLEPA